MGLLPDITKWFTPNSNVYEKMPDGTDWMYIDGVANEIKKSDLQFSLEHPILTPALLFVAGIFSQARFKVQNKETKIEVPNHWFTKLLDKPNFYQSRIDFLESLLFLKIAQGVGIIWTKRSPGFTRAKDTEAMFLLRADLIQWPSQFATKYLYTENRGIIENQYVTYDQGGLNLKIRIGDLLFFYDLPQVSEPSNLYKNTSRITGLRQVLQNTDDSFIAKNVILNTNGAQMISGSGAAGSTFPLQPDEKKEAERMFNSGYGLGKGRSRTWITKANVSHKNMSQAVRDLGLDDSVKVDGNVIYTALHIPKDILSLEAKKTTYNNFKESMTSYIQNDQQAHVNDTALKFSNWIDEDGLEVVGDFLHLPIMQFARQETHAATSAQAKALNDLLKTGIPEVLALEMTGFPKNTKLDEIWRTSGIEPTEPETEQATDEGGSGDETEETE